MNTQVNSPAVTAGSSNSTSRLAVPAWTFILAVIIGGTLFHIGIHHQTHGVFNVHQIALGFFLVLNILVNFWEIGLFFQGDKIHEEYQATKVDYRGRELERVGEVFQKKIPIFSLLSFRQWTGIWSAYALFDPGYAHRGSFGFNIDVFNGFSTVIPATLFLFGMTFEIMPARWLGILGVAMFWQMFYGTVVYFFQFFHAGRHKGHSLGNLLVFVGNTNVMWFIFPLWGIALSVWMIFHDSYSIFG